MCRNWGSERIYYHVPVSQLLRDDQRLKPQPFALFSFTRAGGTILFLSWACAMLLLPAQTWPWTTWDLSLVFHPVTIHASLNWGLLVDTVQGSRPLWWRENRTGAPGQAETVQHAQLAGEAYLGLSERSFHLQVERLLGTLLFPFSPIKTFSSFPTRFP